MSKLNGLFQRKATQLNELIQDATRFIRYNRSAIESSPLQVYASALIFSPFHSIIRHYFQNEEPQWLVLKPAVEDKWNACLSTLEGHGGYINSVAFSPDGSRLASGSYDRTVKVWDAATGACLSTLEGHGDDIRSVAFSPDGSYLITDTGIIPLPASSKNNLLPTAPQQFPNDYYNLGVKNEWITYNGRNLLWLPPDYRPYCSAVTARAIAVGCGSGRVWMSIFSFS